MISFAFICFLLDTLGFAWSHLVSTGLTWSYLVSLCLTWSRLDPPIPQRRRKTSWGHEKKAKRAGRTIDPGFAYATEPHAHACTTQNDFPRTGGCLKARSLLPTSDIHIYIYLSTEPAFRGQACWTSVRTRRPSPSTLATVFPTHSKQPHADDTHAQHTTSQNAEHTQRHKYPPNRGQACCTLKTQFCFNLVTAVSPLSTIHDSTSCGVAYNTTQQRTRNTEHRTNAWCNGH